MLLYFLFCKTQFNESDFFLSCSTVESYEAMAASKERTKAARLGTAGDTLKDVVPIAALLLQGSCGIARNFGPPTVQLVLTSLSFYFTFERESFI